MQVIVLILLGKIEPFYKLFDKLPQKLVNVNSSR